MLTNRQRLHAVLWSIRHLRGRMSVDELQILAPLVRESDTLIDIGAHAGTWSVGLSALVPQGHVHAFEALPYYAQTLSAALKLLRLKNVTVHNNAVLDRSRTVEMVWKDDSGKRLTGLTHVRARDESTPETVSVDGIRLDDQSWSIGGAVRFVKLDIEGAEILALEGATNLIETHRPLIFMELNDEFCRRYDRRAADVFQFFADRGYRGFIVSKDGLRVEIHESEHLEINDLWFVPDEKLSEFLSVA